MKYFIQDNGIISQAYSIDELRTKNLTPNSLVCVKYGNWIEARDIPEILDILELKPKFPIEINWSPPLPTQFQNFTSKQSSPYTATAIDQQTLPTEQQEMQFLIKNKYPIIIGIFLFAFGLLIKYKLAQLLAFASSTLGIIVILVVISLFIWAVLNYISQLMKSN